MPDDLTTLLSDLVAIPSVNPSMAPPGAPEAGEAEVAAYVMNWCAAHGLIARAREVAPRRPNVLVDLGLSRERTFLLQTHMDTVPGGPMGERAYRPEIREGRLYGRGACDAKGQLAAMLWAMARLKEDAERLRANVVLVAAMDEEHTFKGALAMVADGLRADGAIVGEPTGLRGVIAHKGVVRWAMHVRGRAAHTSRPDQGINAVDGMMDVLGALRASWARTLTAEHPLLGRATATVVSIEGGVAPNVVPDSCRATVDRRTLPGEDPEPVLAACDAVLDELRAGSPGWTVEREPAFVCDYALETSPDEAVVRAALAAIKAVTGHETAPIGVPYGTDASKLSRFGGIPCVVLGAGDIAQAHTADEYLDLDQLARAAQIYYEAARAFGEDRR
jgi:acetylornithine deacetylase